jgi:polar amino acid transport system permease protein
VHDFLHYLTLGYLWQGTVITLEIAGASLVGALILGALLAEMRVSRLGPLRWIAASYIWIIRGTPMLLQLVFLYDALPGIGIIFPPIPTAIIGFTLNEAAFFAEIIRGGVQSVDRQQLLAADALGMSPWVTRRRIVLPLALRAILPSLGNELINLIKSTSLASVISVSEVTQRSQYLSSQSFQFFPVFFASGVMYLALTSAVAVIQSVLERRVSLERDRPDQAVPAVPVTTARLTQQDAPEPDERSGAGRGRPLVIIEDARKAYGSRDVLNGVDLRIARGEVVAVIGASGSGKSTLLRLINHLESLDGGSIVVGGHRVGYRSDGSSEASPARLAKARAQARIGMVFQHFNLFPHLSVLDNVRVAPIRVYGVEHQAATDTALRLLDAVGLSAHVQKLPHTLSGGQQQRVAIARALATNPQLMLFDEPTSALDPELVGEVLGVMRRLAEEGMTMIVVTHEIRFARDVADRVVFIADGQVVEHGPPADVLGNPQQPQTQRFLQSLNGLPAA